MIYNLIKSSIINIWPTLVIVFITLVSLRIVYAINHRVSIKFYKDFWTFIGVFYMFLLYELVTRVDINSLSGVNLVPFREIFRYDVHSKMFYLTVFGNIALFVPFGFIVASYGKSKKIWGNVLVSIIVSTTIEFVQLKIGRCFDIDDIILNTVGCMLGFMIYRLFIKIYYHLPEIFKGKTFNNLVCIVIIVIIGIFIFKMLGIKGVL